MLRSRKEKQQGMEVPDLGEFAKKDWPEPEKGFAAMMRNLDRDTGRVLDQLKALKLEKDTLVIFTSDNGPHQEGGHKADFFASSGTFRGTKRDLNEGGIRVPFVVSVSSFNPLPRWREKRAISSMKSLRTSGSPPVMRSLSTPKEAKAVTSSSSSSNERTSLRGRKVMRSGIQ